MTRTTRFTEDVRSHVERVISGNDNRKQLLQTLDVIDMLHAEDIKDASSWRTILSKLWKRS